MKLNEEAFKRLKELSGLKISKRRAAKILQDEKFFTSFDSSRTFVNDHTDGKGLKKNPKSSISWYYDIPTPEESDYGVVDISNANGVLLLADIHLPFHDDKTIRMALEKRDEYDTIILQEVFDMYGLSKFSKNKTIDIAQEQEDFFQLMDWIRSEVPNHKIYFQRGNHDERFWIYVMRKARELENLAGMEFETIFNFAEYDIEMIPLRNLIKFRELYIGHGHEINAGGVPVSPARTFYLKTGGNFIGGHFHRTSEYVDRNIKDDILGCWSVGCACDLHPLYAPINKWNNGFAIIRPYGENNFRVKNIKLF